MSTAAERVLEQDILSRVHGDTVILVPYPRVLNHDAVGIVDVERIGVVAKSLSIGVELIAGSVIANDVLDQQVVHIVDAEEVLGRIENIDAVEDRVVKVVRLEELGLCNAAAAT